MLLVLQQLADPLPWYRTLPQFHDVTPVGDGQRAAGVLLDEQDRHPRLVDGLDLLEEGGDDHRGQAQRRLVEQHQPRLGHQPPGDGQHLALAAAQRARSLAGALAQNGKPLADLFDALRDEPGSTTIGPHLQVLPHRQRGEDAALLGDVGQSVRDQPVGFPRGDFAALEQDVPGHDAGQAEDALQRRRFPGAVGPNHGHDLAAVHGHGDVVQHFDAAVAGAQVLYFQYGVAHLLRLPGRRRSPAGRAETSLAVPSAIFRP